MPQLLERHLDDEPRDTRGAAAVEAAAGVPGGLDVDCASVDPCFERGGKRVTDRRDLRLGEHNPGRERAVGTWVDLRFTAENHVRGDAALVFPHVREQRAPVRVADREEPVVARDPQRLVHLDVPSRLEPDALQAEVTRGRTASDSDQQLVRLEFLAAIEPDGNPLAVAGDLDGRQPEPDRDPALDERFMNEIRGELLLTSEQAWKRLDDRHLRPER